VVPGADGACASLLRDLALLSIRSTKGLYP
jgi:hypothetical protein